MADNQFSVRVPNVYESLMAGEQGFKEASAANDERAIKAGRQAAMQALQSGGDLKSPLAALIGVGDIKGATAIAAFARGNAQGQGVYGTPIYGEGPGGQPVVGAIGKQGGLQWLDSGPNKVTPGIKTIDTPQGVNVVSGKSGRPVSDQPEQSGQTVAPGQPLVPRAVPTQSYYPKDVEGVATRHELGKDTGDKLGRIGQAEAAVQTSASNLDRLALQANELKNHPGLSRITGMTGMLPNIPGFPGADAEAKRQTLLAQSGFGTLQQMREASKTGGALGSVTEGEHKLLQNYLAELTNAQTEKQIKTALDKIMTFAEQSKGRLQNAFDKDYGGLRRPDQATQPGTAPVSPIKRAVRVTSPDQAKRLPSGTKLILPDGSEGVVP